MLNLQPVEPRGLIRSGQVRFRPLGERQKQFRVRAAREGSFARCLQTLAGELADRFEHPQTRQSVRAVLAKDQAVIDQPRAFVEHVALAGPERL